MAAFDDLLLARGADPALAALTPADGATMAALRAARPGAPADYLQFLERIGWGELANGRFMLYGGLVEPGEIYGETPPALENVLLFGDDMNGYCAGFDTTTWAVVEVDPTDLDPRRTDDAFADFIRRTIAP